jgi:hypothetical protein
VSMMPTFRGRDRRIWKKYVRESYIGEKVAPIV